MVSQLQDNRPDPRPKGEPKYSRAEQRERMAEFECWVRRAREDWRRGIATVIMSFGDYLELQGIQINRRRG